MEKKIPKLSVIVPIYNVEKYIERCINSILNQTFKDFELILINDGSTDKSGEICEKYRHLDKRIIVINKKNNGVSSARNSGMELAKGEYIQFIDSDDWIEDNLFDIIIKKLENDNSDILFFGFKYDDENGNLIKEKKYCNRTITKELNLYAIKLYQKDLFGYTWCKIFKTSIIKENNIKFNAKLSFCEDEEFTCKYYKYVNKVSIINISYYHYIKYTKHRRTLCSTADTSNCELRDTVFNAWIGMIRLEEKKIFKDYLIDKAYKNIRFIFSNIVWSNSDKEIKICEMEKLKNTLFYKYLRGKKLSIKIRYLLFLIKYKQIFIYKFQTLILGKILK